MKTRNYTWEDLEREDKRTTRLMAITLGIFAAIACGTVFYLVIDGIINTFK